jgi:SAM-dependent methyltransferase
MIDFLRYDFGYSWPWTYGHLIVAIVSGAAAALAWWSHRRVIAGIFAVLCAWAAAGALLVHGPMGFSRPLTLPTEDFLPSGGGHVLDAGAGSGRATIMVLQSRPRSTVVALDIYSGYYGIDDNTPDRLMANARAAGASGRVEARVGDIRAMPFEAGSFDAAVSTYVIDHLNRDGVNRSLAEIARVLRPDGQFLMMIINPDLWVRVAFPHLAAHGYFGPGAPAERWRTALDAAGLPVVEQGTRPGTLYFLAKKGRA